MKNSLDKRASKFPFQSRFSAQFYITYNCMSLVNYPQRHISKMKKIDTEQVIHLKIFPSHYPNFRKGLV